MLVIRIRRNHIVEDAINQFAAQDDGSFDLKKPLKVLIILIVIMLCEWLNDL